MFPILIKVGPLDISTYGFFTAISFVVFSFMLWRSLRDDYPEEDILTFTIYLFLGAFIGSRIIYILANIGDFNLNFGRWLLFGSYPGLASSGVIVGTFIIYYVWNKRRSWDFWLVGDKLIFAFLVAEVISHIGVFLSTARVIDLGRIILSAFLLVVIGIIAKNYRKYLWYKSGKVGFTACAGFSFYFLLNSLLEFLLNGSIYFERLIYLAFGVLAIIFLYRRSERKIKEDLGVIFNVKNKTTNKKN